MNLNQRVFVYGLVVFVVLAALHYCLHNKMDAGRRRRIGCVPCAPALRWRVKKEDALAILAHL